MAVRLLPIKILEAAFGCSDSRVARVPRFWQAATQPRYAAYMGMTIRIQSVMQHGLAARDQ